MINTFQSLIAEITDGCEYCKSQWPDRICDEHRIEREAYKKAQKLVEDAVDKMCCMNDKHGNCLHELNDCTLQTSDLKKELGI
jgi:hypothetical protein